TMSDLMKEFRLKIRDALVAADRSLDPISHQLKVTEMGTRFAAQDLEAVAKYTHLDQVADAVQTVDGAGALAKGGWKVVQVMKNPEARAAFVKAVREAPEFMRSLAKPRRLEDAESAARLMWGGKPLHQLEQKELVELAEHLAKRERDV